MEILYILTVVIGFVVLLKWNKRDQQRLIAMRKQQTHKQTVCPAIQRGFFLISINTLMEIQNKIGEQVFDKLRSKFRQITLGDDEGNSTQDPQDAVFFNFNYVDNQGHDHGNITVSLIDRTMKVYYSKNISSDLSGSELTEWYEFLQGMRKTAMSNLYGFDTHDITKSNLDIADIQSTVNRNSMQEGKQTKKLVGRETKEGTWRVFASGNAVAVAGPFDSAAEANAYIKKQNVKESKMYGSTKSSYQECGPAKIIVRHNESINPEVRGSRSRKVKEVFIETHEGERFKMPFNSLPGTRAMAQHIGQGGRPYDDIGESISTMVSEIASLRPFVARNRNAIYEDETTIEMVEAAKEYYAETRKTLSKLKGKRGYKAYAESFEVIEQQEILEDEMAKMKERFTKKRFSDKMENAMPVVRKAFNRKNLKPKTPSMKPITEFEEWADEITEMPVNESCRDILSDEELQEVLYWLSGKYDSLSDELLEKLTQHYASNGEMPYDVGKDDPTEWLWDHLSDEYRSEIPEATDDSEMMSQKNKTWKTRGVELPGKFRSRYDRIDINGDPKTAPKIVGAKARIANRNGEKVEEAEEMCSTECCGKPISQCHCGPECPHCDCHEKNKKVNEDARTGGAKKAYDMGFSDAKSSRPKKAAHTSFGPYATDYYKGYEIGRSHLDHEAWQEKTAAKRQGRHYHESVTEQQLDEGILQSVFDFMWNMAGKIPRVAKARKSNQLAQEFRRFKDKMDDETVEKWLAELTSKIKSTHPATNKAKTGRTDSIRKIITAVKNAKSEDDFQNKMQRLQGQLKSLQKFIKSSNSGVEARKRKEKAAAKLVKTKGGSPHDRRTAGDNKLAQWVDKGAKEKGLNEGTWAIPDTAEKQERLVDLLSSPLPFGPNGEHASSALYDLIGDDELFDELAGAADEFGPEADARMTILSHMESIVKQDSGEWVGSDSPSELIKAFVNLYDPNYGSARSNPLQGFKESMNESPQLTDSVTSTLMNRLDKQFPELFTRYGSEYIYDLVREEVSWLTDDWDEDQGFGSSDSFGAWKNILSQLGIEIDGRGKVVQPDPDATAWAPVGEARGRAPQDRKYKGDVVMPKATYSDYLEVYKTSNIGGTDEDDDAKRMVAALKKDGKEADHKAAKGALKRMAEQAATTGLHVNEGLAEMARLRRDAGITK